MAKLTDEEFSVIKQHPVIGAKILMQSNYTHELVQIVLHHHERYDGRGYPEGLKGEEPTILHTDQGSVYSSFAYNDLIKDENIVRSMSRAGTPTDNPVNEALNGWIKEELIIDFDIESCRRREDVLMLLAQYQYYYNRNRPCFALDYDTPHNFYERFMSGEIVRKETFKNRQLTDMPKFKRKQGLKKSPYNDRTPGKEKY